MSEPGEITFGGTSTHGGDVWGAARRLGVPLADILDLSASLNPLGPPPGLAEVLAEAFGDLCHYPDRQNRELRLALAEHLGLSPKNLLPGNGSTNLIRLLSRVLELSTILVLAPAFGEFGRTLALTGRHFHYHMLSAKNGFAPTRDDLEEIWEMEPACIILSNPLTPSGGLVDPEILGLLLSQARRRRAWVVLDEAFVDFAPRAVREYSPPLVREYPRLLVLRSLTKFHCLAGLRLGYLIANEGTMAEIAPMGEPWSVNTLASRAGVHCLGQQEYAEQTRKAVTRWRLELAGRLEALGMRLFPSEVNYLLCELPAQGPTAAQVAERLYPQGILVRDCASFAGCGPRHLRIAVCTSEDQDRLMEALRPALEA